MADGNVFIHNGGKQKYEELIEKKSESCSKVGIFRWGGRGFALMMFLLCASLGMAQLDTGTISGTVRDQSGGAIPGATITIRNVATGISRNSVTNAAGRYEAVALPVGSYEVSAALQYSDRFSAFSREMLRISRPAASSTVMKSSRIRALGSMAFATRR